MRLAGSELLFYAKGFILFLRCNAHDNTGYLLFPAFYEETEAQRDKLDPGHEALICL